MKHTFACTNCSLNLEVEAIAVGTSVECPGCHSVVVVPRQELGPGTTVGGFRIQRLLGRGGMGEVWLASQLSLERDVALKILPAQLGMNPDAAKRFLQEVRMLARLGHPNIVPAWEAGEDSGILFFAMAYVLGESLEARLQRQGAMPEPEALRLAAKVGGALAYAWNQHRLLHRDIKPSNILLDANGEPQVVDLGLAKSLTDSVNLTVSGGVMGTPNYMSPEQARGNGEIDYRTDIYSLGMTLYHMVTGQVPFESPSPMETMRKQMMDPLPDPREFNASVSEPCVNLLETMLAKSPLARHETWEIVLEDLGCVAVGQSPSRMLGGAGGSILMVRGKRARTAPVARGRAAGLEGRPGKKNWFVPLMAGVAGVVVVLLGVGWWLMESKGPKGSKPDAPPTAPSVAKALPAATNNTHEVFSKGQKEYFSALEYVRSHPRDFHGAISSFEKSQREAPGTVWADKAEKELVRLKSEKAKAVENLVTAMENLVVSFKLEAGRASASGKFEEVLRKLENNAMPLAEETASARAELVAELKQFHAEANPTKQDVAQPAEMAREPEAEAQRSQATQATLSRAMVEAAKPIEKAPTSTKSVEIEAATAMSESSGTSSALAKEEPSRPVALKTATEENVKQALAALQAANKLDTPPKYTLGPEGIVLKLGQNPRLQDLRALTGLPVVDLDLHLTDVKDLSPLVGMPLKKLNVSQTKVRDLTPLSKMVTLEALGAMQAPVSDLAPLRGLPRLKCLIVIWCPIRDLTPLASLRSLEELNLGQTQVTNLSPLHGLSNLRRLTVQNCSQLKDLSPLAGLKIEWLDMGRLEVKDVASLRGMPLKTLIADNTSVNDWTALAVLSLDELHIGGKAMKSLHLLKGLSVKKLVIEGAWPDGIEKLPEILPDVQKVVFSRAPCPPSACPAFVFRFPSLQKIQWGAYGGVEVFSPEDFKAKYLKNTAK